MITECSRRRALLRDVADGLMQQMFFWGCDARHPGGNLLGRHGLTRLPRAATGGEGSSRYRAPWEGGTVELHGFCAGWYPHDDAAPGVLFIRHRGRLVLTRGPEPLTPGRYEADRLASADPDAVTAAVAPLLRWLVAYERRIAEEPGPAYRHACWRLRRQLPSEPRWLAPDEALAWFERYLADPATTPRARRSAPR